MSDKMFSIVMFGIFVWLFAMAVVGVVVTVLMAVHHRDWVYLFFACVLIPLAVIIATSVDTMWTCIRNASKERP